MFGIRELDDLPELFPGLLGLFQLMIGNAQQETDLERAARAFI